MSTNNPLSEIVSDKTPAPLSPSSSQVTFEFLKVQPPSNLYIDVDDQLVIAAATSQTGEAVTVNVRLLEPNGRLEDMQFIVRPTNSRVVVNTRFGLAQGYILSISAASAVAITRGQTFCRIGIQRSASGVGQPAQMLFADYVTTLATSAYPSGRVLSPSEGPGFVYTFVVPNPVAGIDWGQTVPTNARWRVRSWDATLTTNVTVANRQIESIIAGVGGRVFGGPAIVNAAASGVYDVSAAGLAPYTAINPLKIALPLPPDCIITGAAALQHQVGVTTQNLQGTDTWTAIALLIEEWLDNV